MASMTTIEMIRTLGFNHIGLAPKTDGLPAMQCRFVEASNEIFFEEFIDGAWSRIPPTTRDGWFLLKVK